MNKKNKLILVAFVILDIFTACNSKVGKEDQPAVPQEMSAEYSVYLNKSTNKSDGVVWFNIKLVNNKNINHSTLSYNKDYQQYTESLNYYLNEAIHDLSLNYCNKIFSPIGYQFENNYNIVGYDMIVVGFDINEVKSICSEDEAILIFNDRNYNNKIQKLNVSLNN